MVYRRKGQRWSSKFNKAGGKHSKFPHRNVTIPPIQIEQEQSPPRSELDETLTDTLSNYESETSNMVTYSANWNIDKNKLRFANGLKIVFKKQKHSGFRMIHLECLEKQVAKITTHTL